MREDWGGSLEMETGLFTNPDFLNLSRRQQNIEIFKVDTHTLPVQENIEIFKVDTHTRHLTFPTAKSYCNLPKSLAMQLNHLKTWLP